MPREPGEPEVLIVMTPDGVRLQIAAVVHGDDGDWSGDHAGTWMMEMWERAHTLARMQHDYGVEIEGFTPAREAIALDATPPPPFPIPQEPAAPSFARQVEEEAAQERVRLNALIDRSAQNGKVLTPTRPYQLKEKKLTGPAVAEAREKILTLLANAPGQTMSVPQLRHAFGEYPANSIANQLHQLRKAGKISHIKGGEWGKPGAYTLVQPTPREAEAEPAREDQHLRQVRAFCRGRVLLMLGGDPQPERAQAIVETLQLHQLRWPLFQENDPIKSRLREIRRPDVDFVLINRFNRRYSRQYQHEARRQGKVVIILEAGLGTNQIVEQLWQQFCCRVELEKMLRERNVGLLLTA